MSVDPLIFLNNRFKLAMNKHYKVYKLNLIVILFTFLFSCGSTEKSPSKSKNYSAVDTLTINKDFSRRLKTSELIDTYSTILLKKDKGDPIGNFDHVQIGENVIVVSDYINRAVYCFDKQGNFLFPIGHKGKGPGEYDKINDILIEEDKYVTILDGSRNMLTYDLKTGKFLYDRKTNLWALSFAKIGEYYCFHAGFMNNSDSYKDLKHNITLLDYDTENTAKIQNKFFPYPKNSSSLVQYGFLGIWKSIDTDPIYFNQLDYNFYKLKKDKVIPIFTIEFEDDIEKIDFADKKVDVNKKFDKGYFRDPDAYRLVEFAETNTHFALRMAYGRKGFFFLYDKKTGNNKSFTMLEDDLRSGLAYNQIQAIYQDKFVTIFQPHVVNYAYQQIISQPDSEAVLQKIKEENPNYYQALISSENVDSTDYLMVMYTYKEF